MSTRKSTTAARTVYTSPEGRVVVTRNEDGDYILSVDDQFAGAYQYAHTAEQAGLVELERRVKQERFAAADEAAELATCELAADGLRIASPDEAGWWLRWIDRRIWVTDAPAAEQAATDEAEMEGMAYHAQRNAEDAAADEAAEQAARNFSDEADEAYQEAYRAGKDALGIVALAMDASMDLTCYCELCGGAVLPEDAALVGEQMACEDCEAREGATEPAPASVGEAVVVQWFGEWCEARALGEPQAWIDGKLQAIRTLGYYVVRPAGVGPWQLAAAVDGAWRIIATEPATPRLLWFARQERMHGAAGGLGLLSREVA